MSAGMGSGSPLALELALAVAAPGTDAMYVDQDNRCAGWAPLAEAVASGRPYCVEVAPGLLAIDVDRSNADVVLAPIVAQVAAAGAAPVLVASGRPGHRHLLARLPRSERRRVTHQARALGLDVRRGSSRLRPPLAPHRLGLPTSLVDLTPAEALAALRGSTSSRVAALRWEELLHTGRWPAGYVGDRSGSALVFAIARGAARAGWTVERLAGALADPTNAGGEAYRRRLSRRGQRPGERWLTTHVWPAAVASAGRHPAITCPDDAGAALDEMTAAAEAILWPGVGGTVDRAVLLELVATGRRQGSVNPWAGHRRLAEQVGVSRRTVGRSAKRLAAAGWLQVARQGRGRTIEGAAGELVEEAAATVWHLRVPAGLDGLARSVPTSTGTGRGRTARGDTTRAPDACRWAAVPVGGKERVSGLGLNAPRILAALGAGPLDVRALAEALGMNARHLALRLLPKLAGHGLISRSEDGRWHRCADPEAGLEAAAVTLGLEGVGSARADQHRREREAYLDWRSETRERRAMRTCARQRADRAPAQAVDPPPGVDPETGELAFLAVTAQRRQLAETQRGRDSRRARRTG